MNAVTVSRWRRVVALIAGLVVGAGAGHFAVGRPWRGAVWLAAQFGCMVLAVAMAFVAPAMVLAAVAGLLLVVIASLLDVAIVRGGSVFPRKRWLLAGWLAVYAANQALPFVTRERILESFHIPAASMLPTLHVGDVMFVDKREWTPSRGDVVVFEYPADRTKKYVKRIVGLPGDEIDVREGILFVNGVSPASAATRTDAVELIDGECFPRQATASVETLDGRSYRIARLDGVAPYVLPGPWQVPEGEYFVAGDNRDNSADSRTGFTVPRDHLIGRAMFVYFSWDSCLGRVRTERIGLDVHGTTSEESPFRTQGGLAAPVFAAIAASPSGMRMASATTRTR